MESTPVPKRALVFLFLVAFLDLLGAGILIPVIPYLVRQFRTDATTVGLLSMSFSAAQFLASPILGTLSDRFGRRPVLLLSIFGSGVGYVMFGLAGSLTVMFLSRILDGFSGGNISTAQAFIADVSPPKDRTKNFGLIGAAFGLGFVLGPAIGGVLSTVNIHAPAYVAGGLCMLTAVFGWFVLPESLPPERRRAHAMEWRDLNPFIPMRDIFKRDNLRMLVLSVFVLNFAFSGLQSNFGVFAIERFQYTAEQTAYLFAFIGVCAAVTQGLVVRRLNPILGEKRMSLIGLVTLIIGFVMVAAAIHPWMMYAAIVLIASVGLVTSSQTSLLSHRVSGQEQGWLLGTMQSVLAITRMAGPAWAGATFDLLGTGAPYWTGACWLALALVLNRIALREE